MRIDRSTSERILTIGMQYDNHRGGIGGVIEGYSKYFESFNFLCSFPKYDTSLKGKIEMIFSFIRSVFQLINLLSTNKTISIVHLHGAAKGSLVRKYILYKVAKTMGRKVIFHCHGSEMEQFYLQGNAVVKFICRDFFNHVDTIICLSEFWRTFFNTTFTPRKLIVLENIIEHPQLASAVGKSSVLLNFLFLGHISKRKGIYDLIEVISRNKQTLEGKFKLIVGGNGESEKLIQLLNDNHLQNLVDYKGWVSGTDKGDLLSSCDVYILPSYNEGLPLSVLEAMSYGKAILSTNVGGIPEIVEHGANGLLINPGHLGDLEGALFQFINNPAQVEHFGVNSKWRVEPYFPESVIPKLKGVYQDLLK